eukprot:CAMPEP_0197029546 /NCGR_PEP_ID=MMETSP1384-20130603/8981_1 /TAXON_ID=29189 /ORGANISM="Ammonia sp." /LENGTH=238 /DNA_ID=CAMNT_0042458741 /DNA_START=73 /DNA_END=789 /DNA_ORIENTATION=+
MAWYCADHEMYPFGNPNNPFAILQSPGLQRVIARANAIREHERKTWRFTCMLEDLPTDHQKALLAEDKLVLSQAGCLLYERNGKYAVYLQVDEQKEFSFKQQTQATQAAPQRAYRKVHGNKRLTLYHVTDKRGAGGMKLSGYKMKPGQTGMFGAGIYFADSVQAAKYKAHHQGWLVTANVLVGKELRVNDSKAGQFTFEKLWQQGYDSVYAPYGSGNGQPERVVYNEDQVQVLSVAKI